MTVEHTLFTPSRYISRSASILKREIIEKIICEHFDTTMEKLSYRSNCREIVFPRQMAMFFFVKFTRMSLNHIGRLFDRDHTTVINGSKTIRDLMDTDEGIRNEVEQITKKLIPMSVPLIDSEDVLISHFRRVLEILANERLARLSWENGYAVEDKIKLKYWEGQADEYLKDMGRQPKIEIKHGMNSNI